MANKKVNLSSSNAVMGAFIREHIVLKFAESVQDAASKAKLLENVANEDLRWLCAANVRALLDVDCELEQRVSAIQAATGNPAEFWFVRVLLPWMAITELDFDDNALAAYPAWETFKLLLTGTSYIATIKPALMVNPERQDKDAMVCEEMCLILFNIPVLELEWLRIKVTGAGDGGSYLFAPYFLHKKYSVRYLPSKLKQLLFSPVNDDQESIVLAEPKLQNEPAADDKNARVATDEEIYHLMRYAQRYDLLKAVSAGGAVEALVKQSLQKAYETRSENFGLKAKILT